MRIVVYLLTRTQLARLLNLPASAAIRDMTYDVTRAVYCIEIESSKLPYIHDGDTIPQLLPELGHQEYIKWPMLED